MHTFESRVVHEAKAPGFKGVRFVLRKMTEGRRIKLRMALAGAQARIRELLEEQERLLAPAGDVAKAELDAETKAAVRKLSLAMAEIADNEITPAWVSWGLERIEGLEIDGQPATLESLIEAGPPQLYHEVADAIRKEAGLTEEEQGESGSPITSAAPEDGREQATSAAPASGKACTSGGTAAGTSPAT